MEKIFYGNHKNDGVAIHISDKTDFKNCYKRQGRGLPRLLSGKEFACHCRRHEFGPWVGKIPWTKELQPTPVFLPRKPQGQRGQMGYSP